MTHRVIIALGSNTRPVAHIQWASQRLAALLGGNAALLGGNAALLGGNAALLGGNAALLGGNTAAAPQPSGTTARSRLRFSRTLWTPDVKGTNRYYMNRLLTADTQLTADQLTAALKHIETDSGRQPGMVTIDLDLMQYDDRRLHLSDWPRPYIQQLLPDIL